MTTPGEEVGPEQKLALRWHHTLHPSIERNNLQNGLPKFARHSIHPTHAILTQEPHETLAWTSRDHRKQRHISVSPKYGNVRRGKSLVQRISHMSRIEYWNISWWVAIAFTTGSVVWVINGFAVFLPLCNSHIQMLPNTVGWTAWLGATIFEFGSILGILEAWNRDDAANFGWGVQKVLRQGGSGEEEDLNTLTANFPDMASQSEKPDRQWVWFSRKGIYWHEMGFLAAFSQLCGASIFWISGFTAIPSIQSALESNQGLLDGIFWTPQVVGGVGFVISAIFIMLEVQQKWYIPTPSSPGWQVGIWNLIGAIGFTLCGALGYVAANSSGAGYQSSLSTFWGGWAFLIGSIIQWYESVNSI